MGLWYKEEAEGIKMKIHVVPGSSSDMINGLYGDSLNIKISAPPVEGKANKAIIKFLCRLFNIKKRNVQIISGEKSRQ
ncbi:MAG: DUF167 domain-containing protein, partial [Vulcanimicrobiota bacterium]